MKGIKIVIAGAAGRMGQHLLQAVETDENFTVHCAGVREGDANIGKICTQSGDIFTALTEDQIKGCEVFIDFTNAQATAKHLSWCVKHGVNMVIGTTGLSEEQKQQMAQASRNIALVYASNYSLGVNLMLKLVAMATEVLPHNDVEIIEAHHNKKIDAPSGTALSLGEVIAQVRGDCLNEQARYCRHGIVGVRREGEIGFSCIRGGDLIGEHQVWFLGDGERVEIHHKAMNRMTFAKGALRAALWVSRQTKGLYNMGDVLGSSLEPIKGIK